MSWTRPDDLKAQVRRLWDRGEILRARLSDEPLFPRQLRLRRPTRAQITDRFAEVRDWITELEAGAAEYTIEWEEAALRVHGANRVPRRIVVPTEAAALSMLRKAAAADRFSALAAETIARFPPLETWLAKHPHVALEHEAAWDRVLAVLEFFTAHPQPGLYRRQIDLPGVDTKFIEQRRRLIGALLDAVLPPDAIRSDASVTRFFDRRYGLREDPPAVRFRVLDPTRSVGGLRDLAVRSTDFAKLDLPCRRVFVTENKVNGLAFPDVPEAIVIFGLGYGVERLAEAAWLADRELYYWGDIDTHGFAILDRFRRHFPTTQSLLMDRETLRAHAAHWGEEDEAHRYSGGLDHLTEAEARLYDDLRHDVVGHRVRLEQERIPFGWVQRAVAGLRSLRQGSEP